MVNKHELIVQIAKKFNATLDREIRPFIHMYELEHILLDALEGYTLIDLQNIKDKLNVVEIKLPTDNSIGESYTKLHTGLRLDFMVDKEVLSEKEFKKYIEEYIKDTFVNTLDMKVEADKLNEKISDQAKLFKLLEKRGIETYDKAKAYFERLDTEESWRTNEALNEYYYGRRY